jgi:hypothetical protein
MAFRVSGFLLEEAPPHVRMHRPESPHAFWLKDLSFFKEYLHMIASVKTTLPGRENFGIQPLKYPASNQENFTL